jgi:Helicase HerA, central domain
MIILHDGTGGDLAHVHAMASGDEEFALFDYVRIDESAGSSWIGQILEPNRNVSIVNSNRLDPTILHGLRLMQEHPDVQVVESVQVFEIGILGQYDGEQLLTPRLRPLPGAIVSRLDAEVTSQVIGIPQITPHNDSGNSNVIGELLNAANVPLCIDESKFNYHIMIAGGTGSGKSNVAANVISQALYFGKCVILHDAKPDYAFVDRANTDPFVSRVWDRFAHYALQPYGVSEPIRVGFYGMSSDNPGQRTVGFYASDFSPEILAGLFFTGATEQLQFEAFAGAADSLRESIRSGDNQQGHYSLEQILNLVQSRTAQNTDPREKVNEMVGGAVLRKARNRSRSMPWLDSIGRQTTQRTNNRLQSGRLNGSPNSSVQAFNLEDVVQAGKLIVIDYAQMDEQAYALILSYFLRICQKYRKDRTNPVGIVQMVDEAHRIFDNDSRHSSSLGRSFERVMREGRSVDHSIILSLQNSSQIPHRVMNNLNTKFVMKQNSKAEADAATQTMGREFSSQSMRLGRGQALVSMHESSATVLAQMAPSPFELMRNDNTGSNISQPQISQPELVGTSNDLDF